MDFSVDTHLLDKIMSNISNPKLLSIAKKHVNTLLTYAENAEELGDAIFVTKEEYQEFMIAKFFVDKCIDSLKTKSTPKDIEEGEIDSDTENQEQKSKKTMKMNEEIPPLEAFHLSPLERKKRLFQFWQDVKAGQIYHAKVINSDNDVYDLVIINKYLSDERFLDLTINACMKKSSIKENLRVSDLVRVSVIGCVNVSTIYKLVVTADLSMVKIKIEKSIHLGKISASELPFPPVEACKFRSLTQYVTAHCMERDPKSWIEGIKELDIDPFKTYSLHPELNGKKGCVVKEKKNQYSKNEYESIAALKQAIIWKEKDEILKAITCANRALELNPKYDLALVVRGSLFVSKCKGQPSRSLLSAVEDLSASLKLNSQSYLALKDISELILLSALKFMDEKCFDKSRETLKYASQLQPNKQADKLLAELSLYLQQKDVNPNTTEMDLDP